MAQNPTCHQKRSRIKVLLLFSRDEATRTPDPYVPNVVRYQLRYIPMAFLESDCKGTVFFWIMSTFRKKNLLLC